MSSLLAILTGLLVAVSVYLLLRRHLLQVFFGLILLSNAVNLYLFTMGRLQRDHPPLIPEGEDYLSGPAANAVPQALILTSIVISFGLLAFMLVLIYRTQKTVDTMDTDALRAAEDGDEPEEKA